MVARKTIKRKIRIHSTNEETNKIERKGEITMYEHQHITKKYNIVNWKPYVKNTLQGFGTIQFLEIGLEIRECCFHTKGKKRWISFPAKEFVRKDGGKSWAVVVKHFEDENHYRFQEDIYKVFDILYPTIPDVIGFNKPDRGFDLDALDDTGAW